MSTYAYSITKVVLTLALVVPGCECIPRQTRDLIRSQFQLPTVSTPPPLPRVTTNAALMLGHVAGIITLPDAIRRSHVNGADKFAGAGALLGLPAEG